jgi:thiamine-monophosphate kinase
MSSQQPRSRRRSPLDPVIAKAKGRRMARRRSQLPGEFELIARYFAPLAGGFPGAFGLTDDCAVIAPAPGCEIVVKTDAIVAGIHFLPDDPADLVARKALRVNLSDLAAKGAVARAYLLDLILPATTTTEWLEAFARGLAADQAEFGVHLIGGDTDLTPGPLTLAVTALGEVEAGKMLRRQGARAGDRLYVTGTIGDAALGLKAIRGQLPRLATEEAAYLIDRYRLPRPRVSVGPRLIGLASATIDVSDGLVADLGHICETSGVRAVVEAERVLLSPAAEAAIRAEPALLSTVLTGGDDYEILFTAPPEAAADISRLSGRLAVPITVVGHIEPVPARAAPGVTVVDAAGRPLALAQGGWTHF